MRFLAALLVFLCHVSIQAPDLPYGVGMLDIFDDQRVRDVYLAVFAKAGYTGVSFFFVLSGFVLTWAARSSDTKGRFWRRRFFKIYPLHVVAYLLGLLVLVGPGKISGTEVPGLFLLQAWVPDMLVIVGGNGPSWSISAEAFFYAAFPLLFPLIARIRERDLRWWLAGVVAAVLGVAVLTQYVIPSAYKLWFSYTFPPVRILEFVAGVLLARLVIAGRWVNLGLLPSGALLVASYAVGMYLPEAYTQAAVTLVPVLLVVGAGALADTRERPSLLRGRRMVRLGEISYAFYLVHVVVLFGLRKALGVGQSWNTWVALAFVAAAFVITLVLAWLLHIGVERPVMERWSRPKPEKGRKAVGAPMNAAG
ncbi:acyltransferase [Streptomyces sp. NPDC003077]|uniref:acyltransferase family protein n=1 Tax=Streptomyces sp. NPDC003077 TaxID=3154443 RepID=UPI0033BC6A4E